mmetsp:Transcript_32873/g.47481  ORF Transcript_32873/g.47481 Transcript_32873/m.47481 type:complete len:299 (-) Transcript_32873:1234-2130(-)
MNITISGSKGSKTNVKLATNSTVLDLKKEYSKATKKSIHRISFKQDVDTNPVRLDDDSKTIESYGLGPSPSLIFKDLGPQIGYRTVFLVEYFGPMLFVSLYALRPSFLFGEAASSTPFNWVALLGVCCWNLHFLKRELETIFVHKFSRPTMPLSNLFKNCAYYWCFGAVIGYPLCSPAFVPPSDTQVYIGFAIFALCELGNLICHLMLSNMRPAEGSTARSIPRGFLFELVACPNYTFEVASWVGFSIMTQIPFSYLFTLVGFLQMADWAMKKHKGYKKAFDGDYTKLKRKAIVPFLY